MRVLWFSLVPPSQYFPLGGGTGGWVESLERVVKEKNEISLSIAFEFPKQEAKKKLIDGVTYYPITYKWGLKEKIKSRFDIATREKIILEKCVEIIEAAKPDIIQAFGSEWCWGLLKRRTNVPIVIHFQGCFPPQQNCSFLPKESPTYRFFAKRTVNIMGFLQEQKVLKHRAEREEEILRLNKFYMGRTHWDEALVHLYSADAQYYYCNESLRDEFVKNSFEWNPQNKDKYMLLTVATAAFLKAYDVILKTAKIIKENSHIDFEWHLCGISPTELKYFEKFTKINASEYGVVAKGRCSSYVLMEEMKNADVFVHTSYNDNSPNAVCEAQYVGMPVIATNTGGVSSLFDKNYDSDYLVPVNDPYYLASKILELLKNKGKQVELGQSNRKIAFSRHNDDSIYHDLMACYKKVIKLYEVQQRNV